MKLTKSLSMMACLLAAGTIGAQAELNYDFTSSLDGFQNVALTAGPGGWTGGQVAKTTHSAGGWQMLITKEFAWGPGGGNANQQLEMQSLAYGDLDGNEARLSFDIMVDGSSFPSATAGWWQLNLVGNSDGPLGWTQKEKLIEGWQNADQADLRKWHFDVPFSYVGWEAGDTWFQLYVGSNSDGAYPVNMYLDNVKLSLVPEPSTMTLLGLGAVAFLINRRRS